MNPDLLNRRAFLRQASSGAAASLLIASTSARSQGAQTQPRIPIGFLGATYSHGPDKIKIAMTSPEWQFVGVCDSSEAGQRTCARLGAKLISQEALFQT